MNESLRKQIEEEIGEPVDKIPYGTGSLRSASGKTYFLKTGNPSSAYSCEANGLNELTKANELRIPAVISVGSNYLLTEYISSGVVLPSSHTDLGRGLAVQHRYRAPSFGFYEDNYIGANPQLNIPDESDKNDWVAFYFNKRLLFQYKLAERNGYVSFSLKTGFRKLEESIHSLLQDALEPPSLLHGDLWSGNYLFDEQGKPVLIDPAVYYGHREADLAMTKVFGGFSPLFYAAYQEEYPLVEGWERREGLYKLYHILNHLNLFGRSYLSEAEYIVSKY